jgi:DNA-binding LacI/PurR family transcriptional regulator
MFWERGHSVRLYIGYAEEPDPSQGFTCREFLEDLELERISGVAAIATLPYAEWLGPVRTEGVPLVAAGSTTAFEYVVGTDIFATIPAGVAALRNQGCTRLAMMGWGTVPGEPARPAGPMERFRESLEVAGLEYHPEWVKGDLHPAKPGAGWSEFREIWGARKEKPDGLIVADDVLFEDACRAIQDLGIRVPEDLTVFTHANRGSGVCYPFPVTINEFDPEEFARSMADMLGRLLAGDTVENKVISVPHRVRRMDAGSGMGGSRLKRMELVQ